MRTSARTLERLVEHLGAVFPSPAEASDDDLDLATQVASLEATVIGGLGRKSVGTAAVISGIEEAQTIIADFRPRMTPVQSDALQQLLNGLRDA